MTKIKNVLEMAMAAVTLALMAYLGVVLMTAMVDPACGADGHSQRACLAEIHSDLLSLFTRLFR